MDDFDIWGDGGDSGWFGGDGLDLNTDTSTSTSGSDDSDIWGDSGVFGGSSSSSSGSPQMGDTQAPGWDDSTGLSGTDSGSSVWGSALSGAAAGSAFGPWGTVIGAGLGLVSGFFKGKGQEDAAKQKEKLDEKEMAYKMQLEEQYYQAHGQQLAKAYQGFKPYYQAPGTGTSATAQIGLAAPSGGPSGYFQ